MQRWALVLSAYQYRIQHTLGKQIHLADCLSHLPSPNVVVRLTSSGGLPNAKATKRDSVLGTVL